MARQIQIRRGSAAQHESFTGAVGEITMDTTNTTLRLHDGVTPGGHTIGATPALPDGIDFVVDCQVPSAENNYTWYRKYHSGWIEQGGINEGTGAVKLPVAMADTNYTITAIPKAFGSYENVGSLTINLLVGSKTATSFSLQVRWNGGGVSTQQSKYDWMIHGMSE